MLHDSPPKCMRYTTKNGAFAGKATPCAGKGSLSWSTADVGENSFCRCSKTREQREFVESSTNQ